MTKNLIIGKMTHMQRDVIIVDNFYENPEKVIDYAASLQYYFPYQDKNDVDAGNVSASWKTSRFTNFADCPVRSSKELVKKFEFLTGEPIDMEYWCRDFVADLPEGIDAFYDNFKRESRRLVTDYQNNPAGLVPNDFQASLWNGVFHVKTAADTGEAIHNHITDYWQSCGELGWNGIIYLNKNAPERSGIKFWSHKYGDNREWMTTHDRWNMIDDIGNVFNRLVLFRGKTPHSGAPGFGSTPEDGRLFQTFFFRTTAPKTTTSVEFM